MGKMARAARSGLSRSQVRQAGSLARNGQGSRSLFGLGVRGGALVPGVGLPPANPRLLGRVDRPVLNAREGGASSYHFAPFSNEIGGRHIAGVPTAISQGYANAPRPKFVGSPMAVVRGDAPVERFIAGRPEFVSQGYGNAPRPSALGAPMQVVRAAAPLSRFVEARPMFVGPAGSFV